jgi:NCS1 family nucleobase:cation symporter-1
LAFAVAVPFMHTTVFMGSVAARWHGADVAYFVNFLVALVLYGGYRLARRRR